MRVLIACEESQEVWKDIPGYEGKYQASNMGNIRSVERVIQRANGTTCTIKQRVLKQTSKAGYPHVNLGYNKTKKVHALVALTFIGDRPCKADVRHKDGNKDNNKLSNLEYGTRSENNLDWYKIRGYVTRSQKLSPQKAMEIRDLLSKGKSQREIANHYCVCKSTITAIKNWKIYSHEVDNL